METIRGIVRNIAIVILLASFLELLLPNGSMRRFVQLIMGLFVLIAILGPVANLLDRPVDFMIPAWSEQKATDNQEELATVIQQGQSIRDKSQAIALGEYKKAIEQQAKALALTVKGVQEVTIEAKTKSTGEIEELRIMVGTPEAEIKPVEPVFGPTPEEQNGTHTLTAEQQRMSGELKRRLGALLGIKDEKIITEFTAKQ
jgi:stage III sporulation protein AF